MQELVTAITITAPAESVVPGTAAGGRSGAWSPGEVAGPLPAAQPLRALRSRPPPSRPPSNRASGLWRDGIPWWFYHTLNPHTFHSSRFQRLSLGSCERSGNKGGGAESARLEARGMNSMCYFPRHSNQPDLTGHHPGERRTSGQRVRAGIPGERRKGETLTICNNW